MMAEAFLVHDHSPMDDYVNIQNQILYTIEYTTREIVERDEKLNHGRGYKRCMGVFKFSGMALILAIALSLIYFFSDRNLFVGMFLLAIAAVTVVSFMIALYMLFMLGVAWAIVGHMDDDANLRHEAKTWVLNDGYVVVSDEQKYYGIQLFDEAFNDDAVTNVFKEVPFYHLWIIEKVYSTHVRHGKIIANVEARHLYCEYLHGIYDEYESGFETSGSVYAKFHSNEVPDINDINRRFYYRQRNERTKLVWYKNISNQDLLLSSLDKLK